MASGSSASSKQTELNQLINTLTTENNDLRNQVTTATERVRSLQQQVEEANANLSSKQNELLVSQSLADRLEREKEEISLALSTKETELESANSNLNNLSQQISDMSQDIQAKEQQLSSLNDQLDSKSEMVVNLNHEKANLQQELAQTKSDLSASRDQNDQLMNDKENLSNQLNQKTSQFDEFKRLFVKDTSELHFLVGVHELSAWSQALSDALGSSEEFDLSIYTELCSTFKTLAWKGTELHRTFDTYESRRYGEEVLINSINEILASEDQLVKAKDVIDCVFALCPNNLGSSYIVRIQLDKLGFDSNSTLLKEYISRLNSELAITFLSNPNCLYAASEVQEAVSKKDSFIDVKSLIVGGSLGAVLTWLVKD